MKKHYYSATESSTQKVAVPQNFKDKVVRLNQEVNELKMTVAKEEAHYESLEKVSAKNYMQLNNHVKALRKAFNTLTDVVMEEIESLKEDVFTEISESGSIVNQRIDEVNRTIRTLHNDAHEHKLQSLSVEQELREQVKHLQKKQEDDHHFFQSLIESLKEDNKFLFEKLKTVVNNNTTQLEILSKDNEILSSTVTELRSKAAHQSEHFGDLHAKVNELEQFTKVNTQELYNKVEKYREKTKAENNAIMKTSSEVNKRVDETLASISGRVDSVEVITKERLFELENNIMRFTHEVRDDLDRLATIGKDSSNQIILDFERALDGITGDTKILYKKLASLEATIQRTKEDLVSQISDGDRRQARRDDKVNQAIYDICRQTRIPNPLLQAL